MAEHRKAQYEIENTSPTPETAVQRLYNEFCIADGEPEEWILSEAEHKRIVWPNLPEADTPGGAHNPDSYWGVVSNLRAVVWPRMLTYEGRCATVKRINYRKKAEAHRDIKLHFPSEIYVEDSNRGGEFYLEYFRLIVEHRGRFKVGQVGPD